VQIYRINPWVAATGGQNERALLLAVRRRGVLGGREDTCVEPDHTNRLRWPAQLIPFLTPVVRICCSSSGSACSCRESGEHSCPDPGGHTHLTVARDRAREFKARLDLWRRASHLQRAQAIAPIR
jgi:hypothetical protein